MSGANTNNLSAGKGYIAGVADMLIAKSAYLLNLVSCFCLAALMVLVTLNVILRGLFKAPILGTYDLTGFLTLLAIGSGLAYCARLDGHIEISFFVDKMGSLAGKIITAAGRALSFMLLSLYAYALFSYGGRLMRTGEVSVTTKTPLFIFAFILGLCFTIFALTTLLKIFIPAQEGDNNDS